jgi:hypothetical protein
MALSDFIPTAIVDSTVDRVEDAVFSITQEMLPATVMASGLDGLTNTIRIRTSIDGGLTFYNITNPTGASTGFLDLTATNKMFNFNTPAVIVVTKPVTTTPVGIHIMTTQTT